METSFADQVIYRKARLSDLTDMAPLVRALAGEATDEQIRRRLRRMIRRPGYHVIVLEHNGQMIALNVLREGLFLGADAPALQNIAIVVAPEYRNQGIATFMIHKAMERSSQQGFCQLWGVTQHEDLYTFYEDLGYKNTGARFVFHTPRTGPLPLGRRIIRKLGF